MIPTIVSFFTNNWEYPAHAERFRRECLALGLQVELYALPDTGDWLRNLRLKPVVIQRALRELRTPILFTDVDGSVLKRPDTLDPSMDFMAIPKPPDHPRAWYVCTLFFNYTPAGLDLASRWVLATGDWSDESALDDVWKSGEWKGRWAALPPEYLEILSTPTQAPRPNTVICTRLSKSDHKLAFQLSGKVRPS